MVMSRKKIIKLYEDVKSALDLKMALDVWDSGPVMRLYRKRVARCRTDVANMLLKLKDRERHVEVKEKFVNEREGYQKVYIPLFQVEGRDMVRWEVVIKSLSTSLVGRAVFEDESAVEKYIRERDKGTQDGYVIAWVSTEEVNKSKAMSTGGHTGIALSDHGFKQEDSLQFVHANSAVYDLRGGRLYISKRK